MKNNQLDFPSSSINQDNLSAHIEKDTQFICPYNKTSTLICFNEKCTQNALICSVPSCDCRKQHLKCIKVDLQSFLMNLNQKSVKVDPFIQVIDQNIQSQIDFLSDFREKQIQKLKQEFQYFGMMDIQKQFIINLKEKKIQSINGKKACAMLQNFQRKEKNEQIALNSIKTINEIFEKTKKHLEDLQKSVLKELTNCNKKPRLFLQNKLKSCMQSNIRKLIKLNLGCMEMMIGIECRKLTILTIIH